MKTRFLIISVCIVFVSIFTIPHVFANTPQLHSDDLQKCLEGEFFEYDWCKNYISLQFPLKQFKSEISFTEKQVVYNIPYVISHGMIDDMTLSCEHGSLLIDVSSKSESDVNIDIDLPRSLLDPKTNGEDSKFVILRDGEQIDYDEILYSDHRRLSMSFPPDTDKIEIVHSVIPELNLPTCKVKDNPPYSLILSPLKQFKNDVQFSKIKCNVSLQLTQRYDGSPACVKSEHYFELIKRGWVSDLIKNVQSRDIFLDPKDALSSYMEKISPTLGDFKNTLSEQYDIDLIFSKFGPPHDNIGSGIHVYVYKLNDLTEIWIGYTDHIWYVQHVDSDGNLLEDLFMENEN